MEAGSVVVGQGGKSRCGRRVDFYVFVDLQILDVGMPTIRTQTALIRPERRPDVVFPPLTPVTPVSFAGLAHVSLLYDFCAPLDVQDTPKVIAEPPPQRAMRQCFPPGVVLAQQASSGNPFGMNRAAPGGTAAPP
jgi:hypothetical protein